MIPVLISAVKFLSYDNTLTTIIWPLHFHTFLISPFPQPSLTVAHHYCFLSLPPVTIPASCLLPLPNLPAPAIHLLNISSPFLPPPPLPSPPFCSWRSSRRGGAASAVLFLRTVLLVRNTDGYYGAAHKLIMLEINCCCQKQPPTCPTVSLCPLMHRIQLMDQMFAQCAAPFKVSTKVVWRVFWSPSLCTFSLCILASWHLRK